LTLHDLNVRGKLEVVKLGAGSATTNGLVLDYSCTTSNGSYVLDESGNNYTGTVNGATWTSNGVAGGAYDFDGSDDYVSIGASGLESLPTNNHTLSAWVKFHSFTGGDSVDSLYRKAADSSASYGGLVMHFIFSSGVVYFTHCQPTDNPSYSWNDVSLSILTTSDVNKWYHVACAYNRSENKAYVYLDGIYVGVLNHGSYVPKVYTSGSAAIGRKSSSSATCALDGLIDEFRLYNTCLSSDDIWNLYLYNRPTGSAEGEVVLNEGVKYCKPLGDVSPGCYTNTP
jgi:hypothetical protein